MCLHARAQSGGPRWRVPLGRRDGTTANITAANSNLPSPFDNLTALQQKFGAVGLDATADLVALSGAHTSGRVQCQFVTPRLYNFSGTRRPDPALDRGYRALLSRRCPRGGDGSALNDLDPATPDAFDGSYYANLGARRGTLQSDQELLSTPGAPTAAIVGRFAGSQKAFFRSFARSMVSMGNIGVQTGSQGEVRRNCRVVNGS